MPQREPADAETIERFLKHLLGRSVSVCQVDQPATLPEASIVATYVDVNGNPEALCICDVIGAAGLSMALSLVGEELFQVAVRDGRVKGILREHFHEICKLISQLVSTTVSKEETKQLRLRGLSDLAYLSEDTAELIADASSRTDTEVSLQGGYRGYLALLTR